MPDIIALCGLIGSGKDTCADILEKYGYKRVSFASVLKDVVHSMFGWDREMLEGRDPELRKQREVKDEYWSKVFGRDMTPRLMLQLMGTQVMRQHLHPDIWLKIVEKKIMDNVYGNKVVITDARFPNECQMVRNLGGKVCRVVRGKVPNWVKQLKLGIAKESIPDLPHISEWAWFGHTDVDIFNNDTLQSLETMLTNMFRLKLQIKVVDNRKQRHDVLGTRSYTPTLNMVSLLKDLEYTFHLHDAQLVNHKGEAIDPPTITHACELEKVLGKEMTIYVN